MHGLLFTALIAMRTQYNTYCDKLEHANSGHVYNRLESQFHLDGGFVHLAINQNHLHQSNMKLSGGKASGKQCKDTAIDDALHELRHTDREADASQRRVS